MKKYINITPVLLLSTIHVIGNADNTQLFPRQWVEHIDEFEPKASFKHTSGHLCEARRFLHIQ